MFVQTIFVSLLLLLLGLLLCFAGFRFFVLLLPLFGFFAGFLVTAQTIQELFGGGFLSTVGSWVAGFVIGLLCAVGAYLFYVLAVAILAATVGYELGVGLMAGLGVTSGLVLFFVGLIVAAALTFAVFVLNLPKVFIVVLSAVAGAGMILSGIFLAFGRVSLGTLHEGPVGAIISASWLWSVVYVLICVAGIAAQLLLPRSFELEPYWQAPSVSYSGGPGGAEPAR
jgi:hypothetical protein